MEFFIHNFGWMDYRLTVQSPVLGQQGKHRALIVPKYLEKWNDFLLLNINLHIVWCSEIQQWCDSASVRK